MEEKNFTDEIKEAIVEYVDVLKDQMSANAEYEDEDTILAMKKSIELSERMIALTIEFMEKQEQTMMRLNNFLDKQEF